jgi:hypothetical protein
MTTADRLYALYWVYVTSRWILPLGKNITLPPARAKWYKDNIKMDIRGKDCGWMKLTQDRVQWRVISYRGCLSQWKSASQGLLCGLFNNALYTCDGRGSNSTIFSKRSERCRGLMWGNDTKEKNRTPTEIRTYDLPNTSQQRYCLSRLDHIHT